MKIVQASKNTTISLGRQGENLARKVVFDLSDWISGYGDGAAELICQRPGDGKPYPAAAVREGDTLVWTVSALDTAVASFYRSYGHCELRWYVGDMLAKSQTWRTWVEPAMDTPSETAPPAPERGWVEQILDAGAEAKASADAARADAERAAALAAEVSANAAQTAQDAADTAKAKETAQTAQHLAETAQYAAEAARKASDAVQAAVAQLAKDADAAKQSAEAALKEAQSAASAAAQALSDIGALYQEMQAWANGVMRSITDEGEKQVQTVRDEGTTQTANARAQADAAADSAAQAAESAATFETAIGDISQLKDTKADKTALTRTDRSLDALWKLNQGISYQFETDDSEAYSKTVPSGAKLADVQVIGGHTEVIDGQLVSADVSAVVERGRNLFDQSKFAEVMAKTDEGYVSRIGSWEDKYKYGFGIDGEYESNTPYLIHIKAKVSANSDPYILVTYTDGTKSVFNLYLGTKPNAFKTATFITDASKTVKSIVATYGYGGSANITIAEFMICKSASVIPYTPYRINPYPIPDAVRSLAGYGWSAGSVCNSIERTETGWQYVRMVGSRTYQDGDIITDGTTSYYKLDEPIVTDITDLMADFPEHFMVETGGTITLENAAKLPVPSSVEYLISLAEVNQ